MLFYFRRDTCDKESWDESNWLCKKEAKMIEYVEMTADRVEWKKKTYCANPCLVG